MTTGEIITRADGTPLATNSMGMPVTRAAPSFQNREESFRLEGPVVHHLGADMLGICNAAHDGGYFVERNPGLVVRLIPTRYPQSQPHWYIMFLNSPSFGEKFHEAGGGGYLFRAHELEAFMDHIRAGGMKVGQNKLP